MYMHSLFRHVLKEKTCTLVVPIKTNWMKPIELWKIYVNSLGFITISGKLKVFPKVYRSAI